MNCNTVVCSQCEVLDNLVVLIPNRAITNLTNLGNYRLILACNINTPASNYPIAIQVGDNNIPVLCRYGNEILANQINKRVNYPLCYGNENSSYVNGQFTIPNCNCLNPRGTESAVTGG